MRAFCSCIAALVFMSSLPVKAIEPALETFETGKGYLTLGGIEQVYYVRGLTDAFRYLSQKPAGNFKGLARCYRELGANSVQIAVVMELFYEDPARYNKALVGVDFRPLPAVEAFAELSKHSCKAYLEIEAKP